MSTNYKRSEDVPTQVLIKRLYVLSSSICSGKMKMSSIFNMRVPAECDFDADIVLAEAATRLEKLTEILK